MSGYERRHIKREGDLNRAAWRERIAYDSYMAAIRAIGLTLPIGGRQ